MTGNDAQGPVDRQALAEQVIVSAGNILVAAGFGREEIGRFFRLAAAHLDQPSAGFAPPAGRSGGFGAERADAFAADPAQFRPLVQLRQLVVEARAQLPRLARGEGRLECFDLAMQIVPLLAEAQKSLRTLASDPALAALAPGAEDVEGACADAFEAIGAITQDLLERRDTEAFVYLFSHMADNDLTLDPAMHGLLERSIVELRPETGD